MAEEVTSIMSEIVPQQKHCTKCARLLPTTREFFYADKRAIDGLQSQCKDCKKQYNHEHKDHIRKHQQLYYQKHKDHIIAKSRKYYQEHKDQCAQYGKQYYRDRKDRIISRVQKYYRGHKDQRHEYLKQYRREHREQLRLNQKKYYDGHTEECLIRIRHWNQTERGKLARRAMDHRRRALEKAADGSYTSDQLQDQRTRQKHKCYYCKKKLGNEWHADHVVPLSRGGSNDIYNIVITCPTCNFRKSNKFPHEFPDGGRLL